MGWPSKPHPHKVMSTDALCRAFNLTISVKEDISDDCVKAVFKHIKKTAAWYYVVCEQETSKRHLHAMILYKENKDKKKLRENIWERQVKPFHPTSIGRIAVHVQTCVGRKWVDTYLCKEQNVEVIGQHLPEEGRDEEKLEDYFPTADVQEILMSAKDKVVDGYYVALEIDYKKYLDEVKLSSSTVVAHEYLRYRMFVRRDMRVVSDYRRVFQNAVALHEYSSGTHELSEELRNMHTRYHMSQTFS